jgi:phage protein D
MKNLKPYFKIRIGSETFESSIGGDVISIWLNLDMDKPAGAFEIVMSKSNKTARIKKGDDVSIELGYEDNLTNVFKGNVESIEPSISKIKITGFNIASKLLRLRVNQVYENQCAGEIVADLARRAGVKEEEISNGLSFPMYAIDSTKNAYEHMRDLAEKCGYEVYVTSENKLVFKKYERNERKKPIVLEYGRDILNIELYDFKPSIANVAVRGESPASFKGASTSHWLTKRQIEGVAEAETGNGTALLLHEPTVKDKDTAEKVAKARLLALTRTSYGNVKIIGKAEVKLGDTIEIKDMPDVKLNGEFEVHSVEHFLSKTKGYTTLLGLRK